MNSMKLMKIMKLGIRLLGSFAILTILSQASFCNSLHAQAFLFQDDFESYTPPSRGTHWSVNGNNLEGITATATTVANGNSGNPGNPGNAIELNMDASSRTSDVFNDISVWMPEHRNQIDQADSSDLSLLQLNFDLWTSQTSPVFLNLFNTDARSRVGEVTNAAANEWQSYSLQLDSSVFSDRNGVFDPTSSFSLSFGIAPNSLFGRLSEGWGRDSGNIFRLDNVSIEVIPETSTYAIVGGICLVGFAMFRRIRIAKIAKSSI